MHIYAYIINLLMTKGEFAGENHGVKIWKTKHTNEKGLLLFFRSCCRRRRRRRRVVVVAKAS